MDQNTNMTVQCWKVTSNFITFYLLCFSILHVLDIIYIIMQNSYGWLIEPFMKYDARDRKIFHHPKPRHEITQVGEKIFAEKVTERPKYNGVPFKLG